MRILNPTDVAAVSGGAEPAPTPKPASPLITGPVAVLTGLFTVFNVLVSLPALLAYRA